MRRDHSDGKFADSLNTGTTIETKPRSARATAEVPRIGDILPGELKQRARPAAIEQRATVVASSDSCRRLAGIKDGPRLTARDHLARLHRRCSPPTALFGSPFTRCSPRFSIFPASAGPRSGSRTKAATPKSRARWLSRATTSRRATTLSCTSKSRRSFTGPTPRRSECFGVNEFAVRLPAALFSIGQVVSHRRVGRDDVRRDGGTFRRACAGAQSAVFRLRAICDARSRARIFPDRGAGRVLSRRA